MSRRKSWFGGTRRKFFSKGTFSEEEAIAEFGVGGSSGIRFQASGVDGVLNVPSHEVAPPAAPAVTSAFVNKFDIIRFQAGGLAGLLGPTSHEVAPAPAPALTGGPWAFI